MDLSWVLQTDYNLAKLNRRRLLQMRGSEIKSRWVKCCLAGAQRLNGNLCADLSHGSLALTSDCPLWFAASARTSPEGPCQPLPGNLESSSDQASPEFRH